MKMLEASHTQRLSWRDPDGFVLKHQGRILRAVALSKAEQVRSLLRSPWMTRLIAAGEIPRTVELPDQPQLLEESKRWLWLEHDVLPFPCHAHEITALQLHDSGALTLKIAMEAAQNGWMLKDASAWNVVHSRGRPVFVDLLSFNPAEPTGIWVAYGQFVRHFLLPLLLHKRLGMTPPEIFLVHRDGISPERAYQALHGTALLSPAAMELVVLPKWLARQGSSLIAAQSARKPQEFAAEIGPTVVLRTLRRLARLLMRLRPVESNVDSGWVNYEQSRDHYTQADLAAKRTFVREHLGDAGTLLDLGCNAGEFSQLAVECGHTVVAADADHPALSRLYARVRGRDVPITPVMLQIGRPTPAVGWQNRELESFLERSTGQFDGVLMLGLIHHLLVGERATLPMLADLLGRLDPKRVILEWIDPQDPKFRQLAGLNGELYAALTARQLEEAMGERVKLVAKLTLPCATRVMYRWGR